MESCRRIVPIDLAFQVSCPEQIAQPMLQRSCLICAALTRPAAIIFAVRMSNLMRRDMQFPTEAAAMTKKLHFIDRACKRDMGRRDRKEIQPNISELRQQKELDPF